jgi:hypothetical protein
MRGIGLMLLAAVVAGGCSKSASPPASSGRPAMAGRDYWKVPIIVVEKQENAQVPTLVVKARLNGDDGSQINPDLDDIRLQVDQAGRAGILRIVHVPRGLTLDAKSWTALDEIVIPDAAGTFQIRTSIEVVKGAYAGSKWTAEPTTISFRAEPAHPAAG